LLDAAYDRAVGAGAERIALDVTETNERAIGSYEWLAATTSPVAANH